MPTLLIASLRRPLLRYGLVAPSSLVAVGAGGLSLDATGIARVGWLLVTAGVLFGGVLGLWFWYRMLPVPERLRDPFSPTRWLLIGAHVALVVAGLAALVADRVIAV